MAHPKAVDADSVKESHDPENRHQLQKALLKAPRAVDDKHADHRIAEVEQQAAQLKACLLYTSRAVPDPLP